MTLDEYENSVKLALLDRYDCSQDQIAFIIAMWPAMMCDGYAQESGPMATARVMLDCYLEYEPSKARKRGGG